MSTQTPVENAPVNESVPSQDTSATLDPFNGQGTATAQPVNTSPWYSDWLQTDGQINQSSYDRLPEHLRHLKPSLANGKSIDDVFTKMANLSLLAGKKGLAPLPADAKPEVVAERNALLRTIQGVPEKPEGYNIKKPDDIPDNMWNTELVSKASQIMHEGNVPPAIVNKLIQAQIEDSKVQQQASLAYEKQFFADQDKTIRSQLAKESIGYDKAMDLASRAARTLGIDPVNDVVFKNAKVFLALSRVGQQIGEDKLVSGDTPEDMRGESDTSRARDIVTNKANQYYTMYHDGTHPRNREIKQLVNQLYSEGTRKNMSSNKR